MDDSTDLKGVKLHCYVLPARKFTSMTTFSCDHAHIGLFKHGSRLIGVLNILTYFTIMFEQINMPMRIAVYS